MRRILLVAAFSLFTSTGGSEVNQAPLLPQLDESNQSIAAILRADGTLVPFAQYGAGGWSNPWPKPRQPAESLYAAPTEVLPHSLGELPEPWFRQCGTIPNTWYFWSSSATPTILNASQVVQVENHSQTNWALLTDLPNRTPAKGHHRNVGIALNVNQKIEPMVEVRPESAAAAELLSFIKQAFDAAETSELKSETRAKVKMSITQFSRSKSALGGKHLYYFEAEKQYKKPPTSADPECDDVSLFQGWIEADQRGDFGLLDSRLFLTNCDRKGPSFATPLGIMTLNDETFLFVTEHGWEDESYIILELRNSGLHKVLETFGG